MGNCLVSKLKENVQNNNLPELGVVKIVATITNNVSLILALADGKSSDFSVEGDATIKSWNLTPIGKNVTLDNNVDGEYIIAPDNIGVETTVVIRLSNYYDFKTLLLSGIAASYLGLTGLKYMSNLTQFGFNANFVTNLADLTLSQLRFVCTNGVLSGLDIMETWSSCELLRLSNITSNETVDIADICDSMVSLGRNTGTMTINVYDTNVIKYNGDTFMGDITITFTSDTTSYPRGWYAQSI